MATFLFWNLNKKPLLDDIVSLCDEHQVDVLILAESEIHEDTLVNKLNKNLAPKFIAFPSYSSERLSFFARYPFISFTNISDTCQDGIAIRQISPPNSLDILLVALHLPSKLHLDKEEQSLYVWRVVKAIQRAENSIGHTRTLIIGDLNMNPFEAGIVASEGLHAVMDRQIARKQSRIVQGEERLFFYNPMWGRMGDTSKGPPGTYYYSGGIISYFWNTFDQVLLRPALLDYFSDENLHIFSATRNRSLLSKAGIPDSTSASDHLPIMISLQLERED
jgi:exonuclease III